MHVLTISEDTTGSLILKLHGGLEILTEEDEAALLERLIERAGGLQNLWTEATCCPQVMPTPPTTGANWTRPV